MGRYAKNVQFNRRFILSSHSGLVGYFKLLRNGLAFDLGSQRRIEKKDPIDNLPARDIFASSLSGSLSLVGPRAADKPFAAKKNPLPSLGPSSPTKPYNCSAFSRGLKQRSANKLSWRRPDKTSIKKPFCFSALINSLVVLTLSIEHG